MKTLDLSMKVVQWPHVELMNKVLNIGYWDRIRGGFSYRISDIGGDIRDTSAYRAFILDNIYNDTLITKS